MTQASYRVEYTEVKPGQSLEQQCERIVGTLDDVRALLDSRAVWAPAPIVITEHTKSDGAGRVVPAEEWDI